MANGWGKKPWIDRSIDTQAVSRYYVFFGIEPLRSGEGPADARANGRRVQLARKNCCDIRLVRIKNDEFQQGALSCKNISSNTATLDPKNIAELLYNY